jgi:hypothetical protein
LIFAGSEYLKLLRYNLKLSRHLHISDFIEESTCKNKFVLNEDLSLLLSLGNDKGYISERRRTHEDEDLRKIAVRCNVVLLTSINV